ncbi:hypothetical protein [Duganella sp. BuS-21]|uniref:hypothetical protein n=1 Tax=Duganella sp. BuS-21 TaxID=2943848 RepID=UPI0035A59F12
MWDEVNQVLTTLHQQPALSTEMRQTDFEKLITRVTNFLRWLAVAMMVLLLILVVVKITGSVSQFWADVAIFLAVAQMCLAAIWLVLDTLPAIVFVLFLNKQLFVIRQRESKHEFGQAAQLKRHSVKTLKLTLIWLEIRIERMKLGLVFFVGGSDKVAILMLAASGWAVWHNMPSDQPSWIQEAYLYGAAFCGGLAIGGVLSNIVVKKLSYQKDLLTLAIALAESDAGDSC